MDDRMLGGYVWLSGGAMDDQLREKLTGLVNSHKVVLFMKGNRHQPACGFSARVVGVLREQAELQTYDVFLILIFAQV